MARRAMLLLLITMLTPAAGRAAGPPAWSRADMDTTCAPCRDFYRFANGGWLRATPMPAGYGEWGSFDVLQEDNNHTLRDILERDAARRDAKPGSDEQRLGDFYGACLDSVAADRAGLTPVQPHLAGVDQVAGPKDLAAELGWLHANGIRAGFAFFAHPDPKHSSLMIAGATQGGLGLPDRDEYLRTDSATVSLRDAYVAHVTRVLTMLGRADAAGDAGRVMAFETKLAQASMTNVQRRDPRATYHKVPLDTLAAWTPGFDWPAYFARRGMRAPDSVNMQQPDFLRALAARVADTPIADWQAYLRWKVLDDAAPLLSKAFVDEDFSFQRRITGATELLPRWKRCVNATDADLGDALGRAYVAERFPPAARERALAMVRRLEAALGARIAVLDWMSDATKQAARIKLQAFGEKIGYPDIWRDYTNLGVGRPSWYANHLAARGWEIRRLIAKLGGPVDKREWTMTAPTVNAYYSSSFNTINFPAGILQPPFYDPAWDDALNYGAIGAVIGHEMTHGFDDRGRQFDADGNLRDWWTADDASRYTTRAGRVADQFDGYEELGEVHVNGKLTLGENIADLGGLAVAYAAFERAMEGRPRTRVDGFTPEQRFFLSWARVWRTLETPEDLRHLIDSDPHSPPDWRVNGPLSNLEEFAQAFGCRDADAMVRAQDKRARIW